MKRHSNMNARGSNKMVMFALVGVLLVSLGYLMLQTKEGFKEGADPAFTSSTPDPKSSPTAQSTLTKPLKRSCSISPDVYTNYTSCNKHGGTWGF